MCRGPVTPGDTPCTSPPPGELPSWVPGCLGAAPEAAGVRGRTAGQPHGAPRSAGTARGSGHGRRGVAQQCRHPKVGTRGGDVASGVSALRGGSADLVEEASAAARGPGASGPGVCDELPTHTPGRSLTRPLTAGQGPLRSHTVSSPLPASHPSRRSEQPAGCAPRPSAPGQRPRAGPQRQREGDS